MGPVCRPVNRDAKTVIVARKDAKDGDEWGVKPNDGYEVKVSDSELGRMMQIRHDRDMVLSNRKGDDKNTSGEKKNDSKTDPSEKKPDAAEKKPDAAKSGDAKPAEFVDRPVKKALEYLSSELAKAK